MVSLYLLSLWPVALLESLRQFAGQRFDGLPLAPPRRRWASFAAANGCGGQIRWPTKATNRLRVGEGEGEKKRTREKEDGPAAVVILPARRQIGSWRACLRLGCCSAGGEACGQGWIRQRVPRGNSVGGQHHILSPTLLRPPSSSRGPLSFSQPRLLLFLADFSFFAASSSRAPLLFPLPEPAPEAQPAGGATRWPSKHQKGRGHRGGV